MSLLQVKVILPIIKRQPKLPFLLFLSVHEVAYACIQRKRHLFTIVLCTQHSRLLGVRQESALRHYSGILAVIAQKELLAAELYLPIVVRLQKLPESVLQRTCKGFTVLVAVGVEHLGAAVFCVRELVLVYGQAQGVVRFIEDRQPVVHVGALLLRDTHYSLIVDRPVGVSCHFDLVAVYLQQIAKPKQYVQIYAFLGYALRRRAAAVYAAVWRINLNQVVFMA